MESLTVKEVATKLNVTKRTVFRWLDSGRFPNAYKIPGRLSGEWRIPAADLATLEPEPPARRCVATRANGKPCQAPALKGSDYCRWHNKESN